MQPTQIFRKTITMKNILIVDDDVDVLNLINVLLKEKYPKTLCALSANEAIAFLETQKGYFDLLITDYYMPNMNGIKLISTIKEREIAPPFIILLSGIDPYEPEIIAKLKMMTNLKFLNKTDLCKDLLKTIACFDKSKI